MSLACQRQLLLSAVRDILPATAARSTLPILSNVLITNDGSGNITIIGTNLEHMLALTIPVNECDVPDFTIDPRLLVTWLSNAITEYVTIDVLPNHILLHAGKAKAKINTLSADEFPDIVFHRDTLLSVNPQDLGNALAQTAHGASLDVNAIPYTRGVYLELKDSKLRMTGLNGMYMIHRRMTVDYNTNVPIGVLPVRTIGSLAKLLSASKTDANIFFESDNVLAISCANDVYAAIQFQSKLIDAKYPNYERFSRYT